MLDITSKINLLAQSVHGLREHKARVLVAIAGAPGSGKSTLAAELSRRLREQRCPNQIVPMDGFHLDNTVLDARGLRARKGAPETFDAAGFVHAIKRLAAAEEVVLPVFDRARDLAVAGALVVPAECAIVIAEGNYLMFDEPPWDALVPLWDMTVRLDVPMRELRARLIQRWLSLNLSRAAATRRAESNDIPNAQRIIDKAITCHLTLS